MAVLHPFLWIAACSGLMGWRRGGRGGCAPSYSVDSCLQRSNGVWWVEVLSYHVFLSSSGMYCPTISSVIKLDLGSFDRSYAMASK